MSKKELMSYKVMEQHIQGFITTGEAVELLGLSTRQLYCRKQRILNEGETGVIHRNRGRKPAHTLPEQMR